MSEEEFVAHESVEAMTINDDATASLDHFIPAYYDDDNWWWRIECGHHMNLFDAALERIDELEKQIKELKKQ